MVVLENNRRKMIPDNRTNRGYMSRKATKYFRKLYKSNRETLEISKKVKKAKLWRKFHQ